MFTGIVQSQERVFSLKKSHEFYHLVIQGDKALINGLNQGASVAINGVCLTAVDFGELEQNQSFIAFDVIAKTLRVTNLSALDVGFMVNVERSLKAGDEIGGHMVSGHIHAQAALIDIKKTETNCSLYFQCEQHWMKYVLAKGFIAIHGASLTVGEVEQNQFSVHLIPETLQRTNIGTLQLGDKVNLEFDQQTMTIVTTLERMHNQA